MAWAISCFSQALYFPATRRKMPVIPPRKVMPAVRRKCSTAKASLSEDALLLQAAKHTVDTYIRSGMVLGLGSGTASAKVIQLLGKKLREGALKDIVGIPTSVSSASEAAKAGVPLDHYLENPQIDFTFDDADIIEEGTLAAIIGRRKLQGSESFIQEKSVAMSAGKLVFIVTERQYTRKLDGSIPVLIQSDNWLEIAEEIDDLFLQDAEVWRRPASGNANPLGGDFPLVTKEGYNILDVIFTSPIEDLAQIGKSLDEIQGVVDHGVIFGIACSAIIASQQGLQTVNNLSKNVVREL